MIAVLYKTPLCISPSPYTNFFHSCLICMLSALPHVQVLSLHYFLYIIIHLYIYIYISPYPRHSLVFLRIIPQRVYPYFHIYWMSIRTFTFTGCLSVLSHLLDVYPYFHIYWKSIRTFTFNLQFK
jgi:hypothetical protein